MYIYVSNETPNIDVFFDSLQVTHIRGPLLEDNAYYPFGLKMAGISSNAVGKLENKYKYNGIEHNNDFDLNMYDAYYRNLDPQIARFWQIDPKPHESVSMYVSMNNNPVNFADPLGDTIIFSKAFLATKFGQQIMDLYETSDAFKDMLSAYDIGGEGSFFGGEAGEYANNTNVVFDVFNDNDANGNSASGGGKTTMQVQDNNGNWVDSQAANSNNLTKDSKTRINIFLSASSNQAKTLQNAANITTHELAVHGAGFLDLSNILHSNGSSDFATYRNAGNSLAFGANAAARNNITQNGYYNRWVQHGIVGLGLNGYYNAIRRDLNSTLSKQGKSLLPNDAKIYNEEVLRVQSQFKNIDQIKQWEYMGHKNNVIGFFIMSLLMVSFIPSSGQKSPTAVKIGTVWFIGKGTKLTKSARATLDSCIRQIQNKNNQAMQVQAVSYNKDFCDECGNRSWKRTKTVLSYFSKHGISDEKLTFTNQLDGELNKVDLFLVLPIQNNTPHPVIKKVRKVVRE